MYVVFSFSATESCKICPLGQWHVKSDNEYKIPMFSVTNYRVHLHRLRLICYCFSVGKSLEILWSSEASYCRRWRPRLAAASVKDQWWISGYLSFKPFSFLPLIRVQHVIVVWVFVYICAFRMGQYSPCLEVSLHMGEAMEPVQLVRRVEKLQATLQVEDPPPRCHHHKCHTVRSHINTRLKTLVQLRYQWKTE